VARISIIGAGITGVTTAYSLAVRGHEVTVYDRRRYPAMVTSFANGGQLSASNAEVWNSWATIAKGMRWLLKNDAPLLLNLKPGLHKYGWLAEFCGNIFRHERNTIATVRLALDARRHMFTIAEAEGIDFDLKRCGILHLYHNEQEFRAAEVGNALLLKGGLERHAVSAGEMRAIEPSLQGALHAGFFTPGDATGDIHKFTRGLADACARRGVIFKFGAAVRRVEIQNRICTISLTDDESGRPIASQTADAIVVCAGVESREIARKLGEKVNIYPVKGYSITVNLRDEQSRTAAPSVSLLDDAAKIVTSRLGPDRFRVAGTAEFNGFNLDIRADRIRPLLRWSERLFPKMDTDSVTPWAGLRPMTPDMLPVVRPGRVRGVYYNTGHGHLGWTLSAATAEMIAMRLDSDFAA
tara:strand:- start:22156 stop:23388 length:1233 start_codon:yes stop_codon:yes gene_type:complete